MRTIINDSSALIVIKKGGLLEAFLRLPFSLVVPDSLLADELLSFTKAEIALMRRTMFVASLSGEEMKLVIETQRLSPALSLHDCMVFVLALNQSVKSRSSTLKSNAGCILLTGDRRLRARAESKKIECHGVLWVVEQIAAAQLMTSKQLVTAMEIWHRDTAVRLPEEKLVQLISRLKGT